MKKGLISSFLVIFAYCYCTNTAPGRGEVTAQGKDFSSWPVSDYSDSSILDFEIKQEYYFQILFGEWLKDVNRQELKPIKTMNEAMARMRNESDVRNSTIKILKEHYNVDMTSFFTSHVGKLEYPFTIVRANSLLWVLFSQASRRAVWHKDNAGDSTWRRVRENLAELRDENAYTFFLRNVEFGIKYQCPLTQKPMKAGNFTNGVDSLTALCLAVAAAVTCYGCNEPTPITARLMGDNQEHWLVYTFVTLPNAKEQEKVRKIFTMRHKEGLSIWNLSESPCYDNLRLTPEDNRCSDWHVRTITVLLSRETGEVLFMN